MSKEYCAKCKFELETTRFLWFINEWFHRHQNGKKYCFVCVRKMRSKKC